MSDGNFMGIFDSIENLNSVVNDMDSKIDTLKLYNLISLIISGLSFTMIVGLYFYIRER